MPVFFSILVPVYNVEKYVAECIDSVLNQSYPFFELILVDDGSTDNSGVICDQFISKDKRIKVFHKSNQGLIHTRRFAIDLAKGDYYVFLDSDDMLKPNALEIIEKKIEEFNCDCLIYGYEKIENNTVVSRTEDVNEVCLDSKKEIYKNCFFSADMNCLCRKTVKASVFHDYDYKQYYHIQLGEDLLQSLEIYKNSSKIAFINDKLYIYRTNPSSMTQIHKNITIDFTVRKKVLEFIEEEKAFEKEEFDKYRDFCISLLIDQIIKISLAGKLEKQIKLFDTIRKDDYYQSFLQNGITYRGKIGYKRYIYDLFQKKQDIILIVLIKLGMIIKKLKW